MAKRRRVSIGRVTEVRWAAMLVLALSLGGCGELDRDARHDGFIEAAMSAVGSSTASGVLRVSEQGGWVQMTISGLPRVDGKTLEGWLVRSGETRSLGQAGVSYDRFANLWRALERSDAFSFDSVLITRERHQLGVASAGTPSDERLLEGKIPRP